jgi:hypothetical protein
MLQHSAKEAFSGSTISTLGGQNIDHVSILINWPPQVVELTTDVDEKFVNIPNVTQATLFPSKYSSVCRAELEAPVANGFVGDKDSSLCEQVFYVSKAQGEPMVQSNGVNDDFRWKGMPSIK